MKRVAVLFTVAFLFCVFTSAASANDDRDPTGFRGLKWGTNIADAPDMVWLYDNDESKTYERNGDKMSIGDAQLRRISYFFYKDRFSRVIIFISGQANFQKLKDAVFAAYGAGRQNNQFIQTWVWINFTRTGMALSYDDIKQTGFLLLNFKELDKEERADKAQRASDAKKDF